MRQPLFEHRLRLAGYETRALELEGAGPPLLLLHGFMDSADTWRFVLDRLARAGRAALALDLPGFGEADALHDGAVLPQLDAYTAAAVRHVAAEHDDDADDTGDVVVVGNSLGGVAALRAAEREELPIAAVVPIAPAGLDMPVWFSAIERDPLVRTLLRLPVPQAVVQRMVGESYRRLVFPGGADIPAHAIAAFSRHHRDRDVVARGLATGKRMLPELRYPFHFDAVQVPAMLVWGDRDRMVSHTGSERLLSALPAARFELLPGAGHCPQVEAPGRVTELLLDFTAELAPAAVPG
jgi:pimeloyl-ACP methyl ester carboxylesterase